jgi:two-component system, NtrC family, sensor histidine kinase HydH
VEGGPVVAAIEFYQHPRGLIAILDELWRYIALGALVASLLLFATLFWLVNRADRLLARQQRQLVEGETFAAVGEMSSVVAHGIRNPLAVIRSSAELLLDAARVGPRPDAGAAQSLSDIIGQTDRLGQWLKDLLAYTHVQEGRAQPVVLSPLLTAAVQELTPNAQARRISLQADPLLDSPPVLADVLGVQQVLRTVLLNALEAVPEGGQVRLSVAADVPAGSVRVRVADSGPGLAPEQLAKIGRPFHTTKPQGLGVGLALARRVLQRSGATLHLHSTVGVGTTVDIHFRQV